MVGELQTVNFHGDDLAAVDKDGVVHVGVRSVCDALGLTLQGQLTKLKKEEWATVTMIVTDDARGSFREQAMIPLDEVPMWLATIRPMKVAEVVRPKLTKYRREVVKVLDRYFRQGERFGPQYDKGDEMSVLLAGMLDARMKTLALARQQAEDRAKLNALADAVDEVRDTAQRALDHAENATGRCSILGYANKLKIKLKPRADQGLGQIAANRCRKLGIEPVKIHSEAWGIVGVYPLEILEGLRDEFVDRAEPPKLRAIAAS
ncbi:phage antirepressor N-terminal domain-containing protein [Paludisphaera rhizosphaerae]|uniref:phage antirepressor N-terminal domain-containing protein n=1 Tax=Paludisphaera rhizosphaerae TaxID=2711216 RepID=UPI0013EA89C1|nr:phage antirepressor N-terminal domain-containing protein [Paludisphaera rhizosphaerae]